MQADAFQKVYTGINVDLCPVIAKVRPAVEPTTTTTPPPAVNERPTRSTRTCNDVTASSERFADCDTAEYTRLQRLIGTTTGTAANGVLCRHLYDVDRYCLEALRGCYAPTVYQTVRA